MLNLPLPVRIYLCTEPTDMRRSFDGLARMVQEYLDADPLSGDLYVFRSRRGDRLKLLYWQEDGYALWYKRLEQGTFQFPQFDELPHSERAGAHGLTIRAADLALLLDGVDFKSVHRSKRYHRVLPRSA